MKYESIKEAIRKTENDCNELLKKQGYLTALQAKLILYHYMHNEQMNEVFDIYSEAAKKYEEYKDQVAWFDNNAK